jgi:imidazolonepropionase-like amidohydrolase
LFEPRFLDEPGVARVVPESLLTWYRSTAGQWFRDQVLRDFGGISLEQVPAVVLRRMRERPRMSSQYMAANGGRVAFGSDTPSAPIYTNPPGYNGYLELREMEAAGLSPRQILASATIENARLFKLDGYGTIEPTKFGSLLLLRENPWSSTSAFDTIEVVIVKGRVIPRETLAANHAR